MPIRAKTRHRLVLLLVITLVLVASAAAFVLIRVNQRQAEEQTWRAEGLKQVQNAQYYDGLQNLGKYIARNPEDLEALKAYAEAREQVIEPRGKHLTATIDALRRVLDVQPDDVPTRRHLLNLYVRTGYSTETLDLANSLLKSFPDDPELLFAKATALAGLQRFDEALPVIRQYNQAKPDDVIGHFRTFDILLSLNHPVPEIQQLADQLAAQHPDNPSFLLLKGYAAQRAGNLEEARSLYTQAAPNVPADRQFTAQLVNLLNSVGLYAESAVVLERAANATHDPIIRSAWAAKLWELGRYQDIADQFADLDPDSPESDRQVLAFRALSLIQLKREADAAPIIAGLSNRRDDEGRAWAKVLAALTAQPPLSTQNMISEYQDALDLSEHNPYINFFLGEATQTLGENDLAVEYFSESAKFAPSWVNPWLRISQIYYNTGRYQAAQAAAQAAIIRNENNSTAWILRIQSQFAQLDQNPDINPDALLKLVDQIQKQIPFESRTLPIQAALLARTGDRDKAIAVLQSALDNPDKVSEQTFTRLADVSSKNKLGLHDQLLNRAAAEYGNSPSLVYAQAVQLYRQGLATQGLALIDKARQSSSDFDQRSWMLTRLQFLDLIASPDAAAQWIAYANAHPDDLLVQRLALQAHSTWDDRNFIKATIDRVHQLTDDDAITWRISLARWQLQGNPSPDEIAQTANTLNTIIQNAPEMTEPRLLLADCLQRQGNPSAALNQLTSAYEQLPLSHEIGLQLAALLQQQGNPARAAEITDRIISEGLANDAELRSVVTLLVRDSKIPRAIALIKQTDSPSPPLQLVLAELYRRTGQIDQAVKTIEPLLQNPDAQTIRFAADLYAGQGDDAKAIQVLNQLDSLTLPPGRRQVLKGDYYQRHGDPDRAIQQFRDAVQIASDDPQVWSALISALISARKPTDTASAILSASQALPSNDLIKYLSENLPLFQNATANAGATPLLLSLIDDPDHRQQAVQALNIIQQAQGNPQKSEDFILQLRELADRSPRFLPVQMLLARVYFAATDYDNAVTIARRTMQAFPTEAEPADLAARALAASGQYNDALNLAITGWRPRTADQTFIPDLFIAQLQMQLRNPASAANTLAPYRQVLLANPDEPASAEALHLYAMALITSGHPDDAASLLSPFLTHSRDDRAKWIQLAVIYLPDAPTAEKWLQQAADATPPNSTEEQIFLAKAWSTLDTRFSDSRFIDKAHQILDTLAARPDAGFDVFATLGMMADARKDAAAAEPQYRKALQVDPDNENAPAVRNNLAMILLNKNTDLNQALTLASAAVQAKPSDLNFRDTLYQVQSKVPDLPGAITNLTEAAKLDPRNPVWLVDLAEVYLRNNQPDEAQNILPRIDRLITDPSRLPQEFRQRLDDLRLKLASTSNS